MYLIIKYLSLTAVTLICVMAFFVRKNAKYKIYDGRMTLAYDKCIALIDKYWLIILLAIFAVFMFTRFYALDIVPAGIHLDEIGYWYDATNLATYGTDRTGVRYPVLPASYGSGHNPFYTYCCMFALKLFPYSVKLMRAVMAITFIPSFFASFGIIYQLYESRRWALLGPILATITPYFFQAARWGLNANEMLVTSLLILYFLIRALKYDRLIDYIMTGVFFGISLLTYHLSYIMMPLFFVFIFVYLICVREFKLRRVLATFIPFAVIGMPTFIEQLVNMGLIEPFYFLGTDYNRLVEYRISEISFKNMIDNIFHIIVLVFGDPDYNFNSLQEFGTVYWASIPLLFVGTIIGFIVVFRSLKKRRLNVFVPIMLHGLAIYLGFICVIGRNAYKANSIFATFLVLTVVGIRYLAGYSIDECALSIKEDISGEVIASPMTQSVNKSILIKDSVGDFAVANEESNAPELVKGRGIGPKRIMIFSTLFILALSFLLYTEFYFRQMNYKYGFLALFITTATGDMVNYEEQTYNPEGNKKVYMELNYDNRDYTDWEIALYTRMEPWVFTEYANIREATPMEERNKVPMGRFNFCFPANFDINEDAVYILGGNWDHIAAYLIDNGFSCDTTYPGYKILYR